MDAQASSHPSSAVVAGPPPMAGPPTMLVTTCPPMVTWRLAERRGRKAGSGNIFGGVNLWQLQRLFRAAGDQDAERRAQLVWGHGDEAELAQALIGLRARGRRLRGPRGPEGREALGSRWLQAFNHLRIGGDVSQSSKAARDPMEETSASERGGGGRGGPEPQAWTLRGADRGGPGATESQGPPGTTPERAASRAGLRRGREKDPERYLHRILH